MPLYHNPLVIQPLVRLSEMKAYCSENVFLLQEGEKLFELDQVENVSFDKDVFSIHGHVYDMTINYTVDIELTSAYALRYGNCPCNIGSEKCHHVVAMWIYASRNITRLGVPPPANSESSSSDSDDEMKTLLEMYGFDKSIQFANRHLAIRELMQFRDSINRVSSGNVERNLLACLLGQAMPDSDSSDEDEDEDTAIGTSDEETSDEETSSDE